MGLIRVVGGTLRGRRIAVPDRGVRPTSERTREAIFDLLGPARLLGVRVLDLFAGTGALGIEALSRGALFADFVEKDPATVRRLDETVAKLLLSDRARVHRADLAGGELPDEAEGPWEIVFLDPPYTSGEGAKWLSILGRTEWAAGEGLVVHERGREGDTAAPPGLSLWKERTYGDTTVAIYGTARAGPAARPGRTEQTGGGS